MFRRLFWFAIGAGVAVFVIMKIRAYLNRPEAIGHRVAESASGIRSRPAGSSIGYEPEWPSAKRSSANARPAR